MASLPQPDASKPRNEDFVIPDAPSPNLRAFLAYADALNRWDHEAIMACFDDELEHRILPTSLGRPVRNKREYGEYFHGVMPMFKKFKLTIHEVVESHDKIAVHASSKGESSLGTPYANEYTLMVTFAPPPPSLGPEAFPKMRYVKEFVDSAFSMKFFSEERAKMSALAGQEASGK